MGPGFAPPAQRAADDDDQATTPPHFPEADLDPATAAMLRAAYGISGVGAPVTLASAGEAAAATPEAPVDAWLAAAVSRALGTFGGAAPAAAGTITTPANPATRATGHIAAVGADGDTGLGWLAGLALAAATVAPAGIANPAATALTPLEQAVRDLVIQFGDGGATRGRSRLATDDDSRDPMLAPLGALGFSAQPPFTGAAHDAPASLGHAGPAASPQLPEAPSNPSHVHLVLDDGPERVVATVAVRGSEVHVALRASDDATAAALARNAASLDHAMRGRGLALHDLTSEREPHDHRPSQDAEPRERRQRNAPRFELEEKP